MPRTVGVLFSLSILFTTKTWRAFMSAFLHGQPSLRAVFFRLQVVLHEQDCIQIKTIGQWPGFELQSTKNIFEYSLKIGSFRFEYENEYEYEFTRVLTLRMRSSPWHCHRSGKLVVRHSSTRRFWPDVVLQRTSFERWVLYFKPVLVLF